MSGFLYVKSPDGVEREYTLGADKVTVGRSPLAGVALVNAAVLEPEHLLLIAEESGCRVTTAQHAVTPCLHRAKPFTRGLLRWGDGVEIGDWRFSFERQRRREGMSAQERQRMILVVAVLVVVAVLIAALGIRRTVSERETEVPALPDSLIVQRSCPLRGDDARRQGLDLERRAGAKWQRAPYDPRDGIEAIELYFEAASCFRNAGVTSRAKELKGLSGKLHHKLMDDAKLLQVRLQRSLERSQLEDALRTAAKLKAIVDARGGFLVTWLDALIRKLRLDLQEAR